MNNDDLYFGTAKAFTFQNGSVAINVGFSKKDLLAMLASLNDSGYVNLQITQRREPSEKGVTHSVRLNTFTPNAKPQGNDLVQLHADEASADISPDDLPW